MNNSVRKGNLSRLPMQKLGFVSTMEVGRFHLGCKGCFRASFVATMPFDYNQWETTTTSSTQNGKEHRPFKNESMSFQEKKKRLDKVFAENRENLGSEVEESCYKYQLRSYDQLQKQSSQLICMSVIFC